MARRQEFVVDEASSGQRLDKWLALQPGIDSRSQVEKLLKAKAITLNGKPVKASYKLNTGDTLSVSFPDPEPSGLVPYPLDLDIYFEDRDLIVLSKPSGLVVHPSHGHQQQTLVNALIHHTTDLSMGLNEQRPGIVHRIDKDTSGLLVVAKNNHSHQHLAAQFKAKTTHRIYHALTFQTPNPLEGSIESHLVRHPKDRKRFASEGIVANPKGKWAKTHYKVLGVHPTGIALVRCQLETGRTHQIRVHLSEKHAPILGDWHYTSSGRLKNLKSNTLRGLIQSMTGIGLHAVELGFIHPRTGENMLFRAPWPDNLQPLVEHLGWTQVPKVGPGELH